MNDSYSTASQQLSATLNQNQVETADRETTATHLFVDIQLPEDLGRVEEMLVFKNPVPMRESVIFDGRGLTNRRPERGQRCRSHTSSR